MVVRQLAADSRGSFERAAVTALRRISGVIGLRTKSVAPSFIASTASSIEAYAVAMMTRASDRVH